jgi:tripartite-type tricarboxylate transporter receptor subunit TctC
LNVFQSRSKKYPENNKLKKFTHRIVVLFLAFGCSFANADDYPSKVVTMIVPFAAGGPTDTVARLISQSMGTALKQQVIVENVGGASARKPSKKKRDGQAPREAACAYSTTTP